MYLIQYLPYFIVLIFILLPAILLGLQERNLNFYGLSSSFLILLIVFGSRPIQFFYLLLSFVWSALLFKAALLLAEKGRMGKGSFLLFLLLSLMPLVPKNLMLFQNLQLPVYAAVTCFSLKNIQLIACIRKGEIQDLSLGEYTGFLLFFPSLFFGPLNNIQDFHDQWTSVPSSEKYRRLMKKGIRELLLGSLYLLCIAYFTGWELQRLENQITQEHILWHLLPLYAYLYAFHLFFVLGGLSRLASGCACFLGVELDKNYSMPFFSGNIREFWSRWHITFTRWLKEFVFCPFLKKAKKSRQLSCPLLRKCLAYLLTMGALGLLYGVTPSYLLFAFYHGLLLCLYEILIHKSVLYEKWKSLPLFRIFSWFFTLQLLMFGFFILSGMFLQICSL